MNERPAFDPPLLTSLLFWTRYLLSLSLKCPYTDATGIFLLPPSAPWVRLNHWNDLFCRKVLPSSNHARLLHSSVIIGRLLVIYGGANHHHMEIKETEKQCYSNDILVYNIGELFRLVPLPFTAPQHCVTLVAYLPECTLLTSLARILQCSQSKHSRCKVQGKPRRKLCFQKETGTRISFILRSSSFHSFLGKL